MASRSDNTPLIAIVGETASGKTALVLELAKQFPGEIIAADSRTVYRGLSIGTAKPTVAERHQVPHHLLDVVAPDQPFNAADFKELAFEAIADIGKRGKVAYLVGGTGLYVDAVLYDFRFRPRADKATRTYLNQLAVPELQAVVRERGLRLPENSQNPRHLIRIIETNGAVDSRSALRPNTLIIGLKVEREVLEQKIAARVESMVGDGLIDEVVAAAELYGWDAPALQAPAYKAFRAYASGELSLEQAKQQFIQYDLQLAKRQRTWFKRNPDIHWICNQDEAVDLVTTFLSK